MHSAGNGWATIQAPRHPGSKAARRPGSQFRAGWLLLLPFCLLKSCPPSQPSCKPTQYNCNIYGFFLLLGYINKYFVSIRSITVNWSISHIFSQTTKSYPLNCLLQLPPTLAPTSRADRAPATLSPRIGHSAEYIV